MQSKSRRSFSSQTQYGNTWRNMIVKLITFNPYEIQKSKINISKIRNNEPTINEKLRKLCDVPIYLGPFQFEEEPNFDNILQVTKPKFKPISLLKLNRYKIDPRARNRCSSEFTKKLLEKKPIGSIERLEVGRRIIRFANRRKEYHPLSYLSNSQRRIHCASSYAIKHPLITPHKNYEKYIGTKFIKKSSKFWSPRESVKIPQSLNSKQIDYNKEIHIKIPYTHKN